MDVRNQVICSVTDPKGWNLKTERGTVNCKRRLQRTEGRIQRTFTKKWLKGFRDVQTEKESTGTRKVIRTINVNTERNLGRDQTQAYIWKWQEG